MLWGLGSHDDRSPVDAIAAAGFMLYCIVKKRENQVRIRTRDAHGLGQIFAYNRGFMLVLTRNIFLFGTLKEHRRICRVPIWNIGYWILQ